MQALSKATPGETYTIQWMFGQPEVLDFLHSHSVDSYGPLIEKRKPFHRNCFPFFYADNPQNIFPRLYDFPTPVFGLQFHFPLQICCLLPQ